MCNQQQNPKDILDDAMVSTSDGVTDNIPNVPMTSTPVKKPSARKSLILFTKRLEVKKETKERRIVSAKSKPRAMKVRTSQWNKKTKQKGNSKINEQINLNLYAWITRHPQVFQCIPGGMPPAAPELLPLCLLCGWNAGGGGDGNPENVSQSPGHQVEAILLKDVRIRQE